MRIGSCGVAVCAVVCLQAGVVAAQSRTLTLAEVLTRARGQAVQIVTSRLALEEVRGRLLGASLRAQTNPEVDLGIGNRHGPGSRSTDFELGVGQALEPGARRSARIAGANAALSQGSATVDEATRAVLRAAAATYYRAVHANGRIQFLATTEELAARVYAVADRRFRAGDIALLDVNLARASLARIRAQREGAEAARAVALGELRQLLLMEETVAVDGALSPPSEADLEALLRLASGRPELRALEAAIQEAEAEVRLGQSFSKPQYGVGIRYSREEGDQIVLGGMTVTFPLFSKGQEQRAVGAARATRLRAELEASTTRIRVEIRSSFDAFNRRLAALRVLETDAMPGLDENEALTTRSFEVGQLGLPDLLLIRRETLDTRSQYLDALLEAALARVDLDASAGVWR